MADPLPLNALRAFETAARTGSFVAAGAELGVSAAAVSQQVKALETHLSKTLFLRQGNRITLTEAGRALFPRLDAVFAELAAVTRDLVAGGGRPRLVVSCLPSLAELWLIPALAGFEERSGIDLRIAGDPVDFARDGVDLRVTYGGAYYPDHVVTPLFSDSYAPLAAPELAARLGPGPWPDGVLIHTDWGQDFLTQPDWRRWRQAAGEAPPAPGSGFVVGQTALAVAAARAAMGVALVPGRLAAAEVARGALVRLAGPALPLSWGYVMVQPAARSGRPRLARLVAHLVAAV